MLKLNNHVSLPLADIAFQAIRAQGAGGQNVNKVSTAIHLRLDVNASSLPEDYKDKILKHKDHRISSDGVIVIKAQRYRSQEKNRLDALERLTELIRSATTVQKARKKTRPTRGSKEKRLDSKKRQSLLKERRGRVDY